MISRISILYLIAFFVIFSIYFIFSLFGKKDKRIEKIYFVLLIGAVIAISLIAYFIEPPYEWDLYKHYQLISKMKNQGIKFVNNQSNYKDLFVINYFYYFIALIGDNSLLPMLSVLISGLIFLLIYFNLVIQNQNIRFAFKFLILFIFLALFNIVLAISGIRTNLAISICALAFYLEYINKRKIVIPIMLYFIALFIHPVSIVFIISRLLIIFHAERVFVLFIFVSLIFDFALKYLSTSNIGILKYIFNLIELYEETNVEYAMYTTVINFLFVLHFLIITAILYFKYNCKTKDVKISLIYSCICFGLMFNLIFFYRCIMFLSFLSIFIYSKYFIQIKNRKGLTFIVALVYSAFTLLLNILQLSSVVNW